MAISKYNKYNVWRRYKTYDSGTTWVAMDDYEAYMTEENAESCGYIPVTYRWVTVEGEVFCGDGDSRYNKYHKEKKQVSYDSGATWVDTDETRRSQTFEVMSIDCGYNDSVTVVVDTNDIKALSKK